MDKNLVIGAVLTGTAGFALAGCWLFGYCLGIEYALNSVANLRRVAECEGEEGCEWVFHSGMGQLGGERVASTQHGDRYARPFEGAPILGKITYDLAHPAGGPVRVRT